MTDNEIVEILATRGMGWTKVQIDYGFRWEDKSAKLYSVRSFTWNPLTDLNAVREVEERLGDEHWDSYMQELIVNQRLSVRDVCHASARTKATALARVLAGDGREG